MRLSVLLRGLLLSLLPILAVAAPPAAGRAEAEAAPEFDYKTSLRISQAAIGNVLGDYPLTESNGRQLTFSAFRGKPLVLSLVYTSCYQICPMTTRHLAKVVAKARDALGEESFNVVLVGFDTAVDTPKAMGYFAKQQGVSDQGWRMFSVEAENLEALTRDLGFVYFPSTAGFDHIIQATIIDAEGKIYRQVYGQVFDTPLLVEPLKELILGRPRRAQTFFSDLVNKVRFFCTTYDPTRDGYYFDYSLFIGLLIGAMIIISGGVFMVREILYRRRFPRA